jgi:MFS family permease
VAILLGGTVLVAIWAAMIALIARVATNRGRSLAVWAIVGGIVGIAGFGASREVLARAMDASPLASNWWLFGAFAPLVCVAVPMAALALALQRMPVRVARRAVWRVHTPGKGEGTLAIEAGALVLEWRELRHRVALDQLRDSRVDGECVRVSWTADGSEVEQVLMPLEAPQTRAGRQAQCAALVRLLKRR